MTFDDVLEQVITLLQRQGRVSYRALKRRFALDDDYLEDLKEELIHAQRVATDEDGRILVWTGDTGTILALVAPLPQTAQQPTVQPARANVRIRERPSDLGTVGAGRVAQAVADAAWR